MSFNENTTTYDGLCATAEAGKVCCLLAFACAGPLALRADETRTPYAAAYDGFRDGGILRYLQSLHGVCFVF